MHVADAHEAAHQVLVGQHVVTVGGAQPAAQVEPFAVQVECFMERAGAAQTVAQGVQQHRQITARRRAPGLAQQPLARARDHAPRGLHGLRVTTAARQRAVGLVARDHQRALVARDRPRLGNERLGQPEHVRVLQRGLVEAPGPAAQVAELGHRDHQVPLQQQVGGRGLGQRLEQRDGALGVGRGRVGLGQAGQQVREAAQSHGHVALRERLVGRAPEQRFLDAQGLGVAVASAGGVAQIGLGRPPLHVADTHVRVGHLAQQRLVTGLVAQHVEVREGVAHQKRPGGRCARQVGDGVVQVVERRVGQRAQVVEATLRARALAARHAPLPGGRRATGQQRSQDQRAHGHRGDVPARETACPIRGRVGTRAHGPALDVAAQVVGQRLGRRVTPLRFLVQRLEHDGVEVAAQPARETTCVGVRTRRALGHGPRRGVRRARRRARQRGGCRGATGAEAETPQRAAGRQRLLVAHHARQFVRRARAQAMRGQASEQLVQKRAERVDVAGRRHRQAAHLLGTGVLGRQRPQQRERGHVAAALSLEQPCDAEVEQARHPVARHEHVAGLEVAVHDQVLVGVLHRPAHLDEQAQALGDRQAARVGVGRDRGAGDVVHHEVGPAVFGGASVEQARDVRVLEARQDAPLVVEQPARGDVVDPAPEHLDRHGPADAVGPARAIDDAHASAPQFAFQAIGAEVPLHGGFDGRAAGVR